MITIWKGGIKTDLAGNWFCSSIFSFSSPALLYELLYEKVFDMDVKKIMAERSAGVAEESNGSSEVSASDSEDDNYR